MSTDPREIVIKLKAQAEALGFSDFKRQLEDAKRAIEDVGRAGAGGGQPAGLQGAVQSAVSQAAAGGIDPARAQQLINQTLGTSTRAAARRTAGTPTTAAEATAVTGEDDGGDDFEAARTRARILSQRLQASGQTREERAAQRLERRRNARAQTAAEDQAREQDRAFSNVRTGRQVGSLPDEQAARRFADLMAQDERDNAKDDRDRENARTRVRVQAQRQQASAQGVLASRVQRRKQISAEDEAREAGRAFSSVRTGRQIGDLPEEEEAEPAAGPDSGGAGGGGGPPGRRRQGARGFVQGLLPSTPEQIVRFAAALTGLQLGLDVIAGAARRVHQAILQAVQAEALMETTSRSLAATVGGGLATSLGQSARAAAAAPDTTGNQQQFTQAFQTAQTLSQQYGLTTRQIEQVVTASGRLARIHGVDLVQAESAVQSAIQGNTGALDQFGISLTDASGNIRGVGASYQQLVDVSGRAQATQTLLRQTLDAVASQQGRTTGTSTALADALERLTRAGEQSKQALGTAAAAPVAAGANVAADVLSGRLPDIRGQVPRAVAAALPAPFNAVATGLISAQDVQNKTDETGSAARQEAMQRAAQAAEDVRTAEQGLIGQTAEETRAIEEQVVAMRNLELNARNTAATLSSLAERQGRLSQLGNAARGRDFLTTPQDRAIVGQTEAASDLAAQGAQRIARSQAAVARQRLVETVGVAQGVGPNAVARAQSELDEFDRRAAARTAQTSAQEASRLAARAGADAQSRLQTLAATDQQRQLNAAQQVADLRTETLGREGGIVELQRQEADLADRMRVAQRENLDLVLQETAARQSALGPANALATVQFNQRRALLEIQARRQDVRLGVADASTLSAIPDLRQQLRTAVRQTPRAELNDLLAQRQVQLQEQRVTADQLARTVRVTGIEGQQRGLEDQLTPLQQAQRLTDQRTADLNRQLELAQLAETAERTAAEQAALAASEIVNASDAAARRSEEWAANINDGLTDLQRAQSILADLGNVGIGATTNNVNAQITVVGAGDPAEVARQVLQLLNGTATSARAASVTQDRHGH